MFLSATPLNLGNDDLYSLLELLAPGEFDDRFVLEQRLEPNAVLHQISASLFEQQVSNAERLRMLRGIEMLSFGRAVAARPEYKQLQGMLSKLAMSPGDVAQAKRLIAQLHALSAVVTRTRKVEVQEHKAVREAIPIPVEWTAAEARFYEAFKKWQIERARALRMPIGFVTQMPLRLASTCLPAARDRVVNWRDGEGDDDLDDEADEATWDLTLPPPQVVELARALGDVDTKFDVFLPQLEALIKQGRRVLVFTFSRRTLAYLRERLAPRLRVAVLHGEIDREERHRTMKRFRDHEFDVLLASRVASEGLDFEFCSAVVNYDLPWNPMEVEQRIGRVDRYGQTEEKIFVLNFYTPGTIESDIIERVHQRIGVFKDSIGELEPILQSRMADLRRTMFDFKLTEVERNRRLDEMLTAIEEQRLALGDVETAASYLSSTDQVEIDGLEQDLLANGRYIGQLELVHLLRDWTADAPGAQCTLARDGAHLTFRGTASLEVHLRGVETAGERSRAEIDHLAKALLDERDVVLCLDQEHARVTGQPLLSANHPLVRAALRVRHAAQARCASVTVRSSDALPGRYFVLLAVARWRGLRPSTEFWTPAVDMTTGEPAGDAVGAVLLVALAEGRIHPGSTVRDADLPPRLRAAGRQLRRRQHLETEHRQAMNEALVETRRISLRETHDRKVAQIERRIQTLRDRGSTGVVHLHEAQLAHQDRRLKEEEASLEKRRVGSMDVETIAVCALEVVPA